MSTNRYRLDTDYISRNLRVIQRDIGNYKPEEMRRALVRLADSCGPHKPCPACGGGKTHLHGGEHNWCVTCELPYKLDPEPASPP